ncbi:cytidylyltransferase domain-containing protein [Thermodesulfobacteriota bacterium]
MRKVAIVQARTGSTRLPGKVLIKIKGKTVLEHLLDRLSFVERIDETVVATTDNPGDKKITELVKKLGLACFEGSEEDVLSRFLGAAEQFNADLVIRISADCPLIDPIIVDNIINLHLEKGGDYSSNVLKRTFPKGIAAEVFPTELLERLAIITQDKLHREHVTSFVRENPSRFEINSYENHSGLYNPDWRWVLDTYDDLQFVLAVYDRLYNDNGFFGSEEVLELINNVPELMMLCQREDQYFEK